MQPGFVLLVQLIQIINRYALLLGPATFRHARGTNLGIGAQIDETIKTKLAERIEQVGGPLLVNGPLRIGHQARFEAVAGENVPTICILFNIRLLQNGCPLFAVFITEHQAIVGISLGVQNANNGHQTLKVN